jgi:RNA polymerase sigma-70 factor (ECF subfamily)
MDVDERLQIEAAQQDPARFGELYEQHFEPVYAFVARRVRDRAAAEDVTAEVFHKALAALPGFQFVGAPFGARISFGSSTSSPPINAA